MSDDLVKRLRELADEQDWLAPDNTNDSDELREAANRIEALQRALLPFAKAADALDEEAWDNLHIEGSNADITGEHCRVARAALEGKDGQKV